MMKRKPKTKEAHPIVQFLAVFPIILCCFPFPLVMPVVVIGMAIEQQEWQFFALFFGWLALGIGTIVWCENNGYAI